MKWIFKIIDKLRLPTLFEILWHLITRVSKLNQDEIDAASSVLGRGGLDRDHNAEKPC